MGVILFLAPRKHMCWSIRKMHQEFKVSNYMVRAAKKSVGEKEIL
jgi:hypothetical protein